MPMPHDPTGSDLKSTNGPAAFCELAGRMQLIELAQPEATRPNNVSVSSDQESQTITVSMSLPISTTINNLGRPEDIAQPYMPAPFVTGTGTLKGDTYPETALELATLIEGFELAQPEADRPDRMQINKAGGIATITYTTPAVITFDAAGRTVLTAADYA